MVDTKDLLDDAIVTAIENLDGLAPGSDERASAVEELNKLYKLKLEETKTEKEYEEKWHQRVMQNENFEEDVKARRVDWVLRGIGIGVPLIFTTYQMHKVLKFEKDGVITSAVSRWTINGLPKLWK